jgi:phosphate transport system substrate-binding protein
MGELITAVRNYDGSASAIGYTVYYYANDMKMADGLKILAVNDIAPNDETIASGEYPFLNPYYTVISAGQPEDSPARILYEWLLSPEGQNLIKFEGYVPVAGQEGP